ncbi:hypothetical protein AYX13_05548 [Cryptococcus neoformans]|nr:hypothetical protein AYX13_05548 [Cryptococcus neoformans var. grubii]
MPRLSTLGSLLRMLPRRPTLLASIFRFGLLQSTNRANRLTFRINGILIYHHTPISSPPTPTSNYSSRDKKGHPSHSPYVGHGLCLTFVERR